MSIAVHQRILAPDFVPAHLRHPRLDVEGLNFYKPLHPIEGSVTERAGADSRGYLAVLPLPVFIIILLRDRGRRVALVLFLAFPEQAHGTMSLLEDLRVARGCAFFTTVGGSRAAYGELRAMGSSRRRPAWPRLREKR